jgi:hypothetical protein
MSQQRRIQDVEKSEDRARQCQSRPRKPAEISGESKVSYFTLTFAPGSFKAGESFRFGMPVFNFGVAAVRARHMLGYCEERKQWVHAPS